MKVIVAFLLRLGKWKLVFSEAEQGLYKKKKHKSRGRKHNFIGASDKALTGSSLASWEQWDRVL